MEAESNLQGLDDNLDCMVGIGKDEPIGCS